ncbi:hypothetical protein RBXJA2T_17367 [Rubrivivax benzoatilyticus JA2 = ATCC BAA-35]|nr:hypothetical protein RBXJA2T_17367 [Rubrivivax benzoatilyticus JA2 = ATCC BAA-35]
MSSRVCTILHALSAGVVLRAWRQPVAAALS